MWFREDQWNTHKSTIDAYSRAIRRIKTLYDCCPDKLTKNQLENYFSDLIEGLICATRKMRYRVFLLATYSMGLRLTEALSLEVGDIGGDRKLVHIRRGKGHKDRMVPLPDRTLHALRVIRSVFWFLHVGNFLGFKLDSGQTPSFQATCFCHSF